MLSLADFILCAYSVRAFYTKSLGFTKIKEIYNMQVTVENKGELLRQMNVTVPAAEIETIFNERLAAVGKTVKVQGFREGKVPSAIVKQRYGTQVLQDITSEVIGKSMDEAFQKEKLAPAGEPKIENAGLPEIGKDFSYDITFEIYPEIEPKKYSGIKVERPTSEVSDKMVDDVLERLASGNKSFAEKKGKAATGDRVTMDAQGFLAKDDSEIPGSNLNNHKAVIGSNMLIPGFEEELVGLKAGDEKSFDIVFPANYHSKDLEGAEAKFTVKVSMVEKAEEVAIDDTFAKNFGADSIKDLKAKVSDQLKNDIEHASEMKLKKEMFDKLCDSNKEFAIPECLIDGEFASLMQAQMNELRQRGLGIEALGKTEDELKVEFKELSERRVRLGILLTAIAKKEKIEVEQAEMDAEIEKIAEGYGDKAEQVRSYYSNPQNRQMIQGPLFEKKVVSWICDNGTVKDTKIDAEELLKEMQ